MHHSTRRTVLQRGFSLGIAGALPGLTASAFAADQGPIVLYNGQHKATTQK